MVKVELTAKARRDLKGIEAYIALDNPIRAKSFVRELLLASVETIGAFPLAYPVYNQSKGIRRFVYRAYNIYYKIDSRFNVVKILHMLNAAQSYNTTLKNL